MKKNVEQIISEYWKRIAAGESTDTVVSRLYEEGVSILDSIKVVRALYGISLREAKAMVSEHPVWANAVDLTPFFEDIIALGPDATYGDWIEVYRFGLSQKGRFHISANQRMLDEVETLLKKAPGADEETARDLLQRLAPYADDLLDVLIVLLEKNEGSSLESLIVLVIHEIGFPSNVRTLPWLVNIAIDSRSDTINPVVETLKDMDTDVVVRLLIAVLLNRDDENNVWGESVNGVCRLLLQKKEWMSLCGPSITYLLAQNDYKPKNRPERELLLSVLEPVSPSCNYAIPAIYRIAFLEKENDIGKKAKDMLRLFSENDLRPYYYCLEDL